MFFQLKTFCFKVLNLGNLSITFSFWPPNKGIFPCIYYILACCTKKKAQN
eukprot:TRINITY_DN6759_c0_g1_i1.p2 TRINITY_DN6759_c0_g1~~TRINITY_DN6759_c0_g1_i1.p2  ORF type:complete len:50 (+),score=2.37 TRINITY_DN6759_c0_g1_i1:363-512(+)